MCLVITLIKQCLSLILEILMFLINLSNMHFTVALKRLRFLFF